MRKAVAVASHKDNGMYIVIYDPETMKPMFTAQRNDEITIEFFEEKGYTCILNASGNISNKYITPEGDMVDMSTMDITYPDTNTQTGVEYVIDNIPDNTNVYLDGELLGVVNDGNAEFIFDEIGAYDILLKNDPEYISKTVKVNVNDEV